MISPTEKIKVTNYICEQIRHVTCFECCNYYREPYTAACGHSLCHKCWVGRHKCPFCNSQVDHKTLKHNIPLQLRRESVHALKDAFTQHFNINLDEYLFNNNDLENKDNKKDTENVADWLANSQNQFSAPVSMEPSCTQYEGTHKVTTKVQIHETNNNTADPVKKVYRAVSQHDWDVIDEMPDVNNDKKRENIIGPKDVEPFNFDDKEYSTENPRRSSRKRKAKNKVVEKDESIDDIENINNCNLDTNSKVNKIKEYWNNVKRMKKDLNNPRKRSSKLDVSIENCKHVQEMSSKSNSTDNTYLLQTIKGKEDKGEYNPTIEEVKKPCDENQEKNVKVIPVHNKTTNHNISGDAVVLHTETCYKHSSKEMDNNKLDIIENRGVIQNKTKKLISNIGENTEKDTTNKKIQMRMPFFKKGPLCPRQKGEDNHKTNISQHISEPQTMDEDDDIKISIKMGNTIANIVIKKKESDVCMKMMTDQGIQTDLRSQEPSITTNSVITLKNVSEKNIDSNLKKNQGNVIGITSKNILNLNEIVSKPESSSSSTKKHTASAETETVGEVITVEKELANAVECCKDLENEEEKDLNSEKHVLEEANVVEPEEISVHDADIFETESVKGSEDLVLKQAPSEILMPTVGSRKFRDEKYMTKRKERENDSEDQSSLNKKHKYVPEKETEKSQAKFEEINTIRDSDSIIYDNIMSQVFANIDEDIECIRNSQKTEHNNKEMKISNNTINSQNPEKEIEKNTKVCQNFENSISFLDSENQNWDDPKNVEDAVSVLCIDQFTPSTSKPNIMKSQKNNQKYAHEKMAIHDNDDSDRSVVEETPEKNISLPKIKQKTNTSIKQLIDSKTGSLTKNKSTEFSSSVKSVKIVTFEDSIPNTTIVDKTLQKNSLETPMSIDKFVGAITHRSTPVAKKSLNFDTENIDDPEQTLCSSIDKVAKNTQEKEIMLKAFECTPKVTERVSVKKQYCVAGSCLNGTELMKLKILCKENNWAYVDKYTKDLTHLVVSVDEENMSQRSVKYIRALAASKWIVSYAWVEKCLAEKRVVNEEFFEALDSTGEPGPMRSRTSKRKVFTGFKFFCMPPFSILDEDALKDMLASSGGQVVNSVQQVQVTENPNQPALLLAEPDNTQEDCFVYLAMEHSVVPVNYEWVLNCLGSYSLQSIQDLLLCPSTLLPPETSKWPSRLLSHDLSF